MIIPPHWRQLRSTVEAVVKMLEKAEPDSHGITKRARDLLQLELDNTKDADDPIIVTPTVDEVYEHSQMAMIVHANDKTTNGDTITQEAIDSMVDDDEPAAICTLCGRKTWSPNLRGSRCNMLQPNDKTCPGIMADPLPEGEFCGVCNRNPCVCKTFHLR